MQYLALAAALPLLAAAGPVARRSNPADGFAKFGLKVHVPHVANPDCHSDFEGTYIGGYHTGAGMNDAVAYNNLPFAQSHQAYLNNSRLLFDFSGNSSYNQPFALELAYANEASYNGATINLDYNPTGPQYFINETAGLQIVQNKYAGVYAAFDGWLLCDFVHTPTPSLFWKDGSSGSYPKSCEEVQLLADNVY